MLEYLKQVDVQLLLTINHMHSTTLDNCMVIITHRYTWIPFYVGIIIFLFLKKRKDFFPILIFLIACVVCSDLFASSLMKPLFQRLRPCHNEQINGMLHLIDNVCGGRYGFISSHSANTFALSTFLCLYLGKEYKWIALLFIWAAIVSLSRVYLGVHYPSDIGVGAIAGMLIAFLFYRGYTIAIPKMIK